MTKYLLKALGDLQGLGMREPCLVIHEAQFRVGALRTPITVKLFRRPDSDGVWFWQSHFIHTPVQAGPYVTSRPWARTAPTALRLAFTTFIPYYNTAVKEGHEPRETWLVENDDSLA